MSTPAVRGVGPLPYSPEVHIFIWSIKLQRKTTFHFAEKGQWASPSCHHQPVSLITNLSLCSHRGGPAGRRTHKLTGKAPVAESSFQPQRMDRHDPHPALIAVQVLQGWVWTRTVRGSLRSVKLPVYSQPTTEMFFQTLLCVFKLNSSIIDVTESQVGCLL